MLYTPVCVIGLAIPVEVLVIALIVVIVAAIVIALGVGLGATTIIAVIVAFVDVPAFVRRARPRPRFAGGTRPPRSESFWGLVAVLVVPEAVAP